MHMRVRARSLIIAVPTMQVLLNPVAAMIDGTSPAIQHYKSGVLSDPTQCTAAPSHAVTVVGLTKDYYVIKNSWGTVWGEEGYLRLKRGVGGDGMCHIALAPSYPVKASGQPKPDPPPASPPRPKPAPKTHYGDPGLGGCETGEIMGHIPGVSGTFCAPSCPSTTPPPYNTTCPKDKPPQTTAEGYCILAVGSKYYCALECGPSVQGGTADLKCPQGATCVPSTKPGEKICTYARDNDDEVRPRKL